MSANNHKAVASGYRVDALDISLGEILKEEFLAPLGWTQADLARKAHLAPQAISEILNDQRNVTVLTARKLADALNISPMLLLNLQARCNLRIRNVAEPSLADIMTPSPELPAAEGDLDIFKKNGL